MKFCCFLFDDDDDDDDDDHDHDHGHIMGTIVTNDIVYYHALLNYSFGFKSRENLGSNHLDEEFLKTGETISSIPFTSVARS